MELYKNSTNNVGNKTNFVSLVVEHTRPKVSQLLKPKRKLSFGKLWETRRHIANIQHWCDNCCSHINPWEMYEKDVLLMQNWIIEFKKHINPECEPPEDPDFEDYLDNEDNKDFSLAA